MHDFKVLFWLLGKSDEPNKDGKSGEHYYSENDNSFHKKGFKGDTVYHVSNQQGHSNRSLA
jgi:hypothetical protein